MEKSLKLIEYFVFVYRHCFVNQLLAAPATATVLFKKSCGNDEILQFYVL